MPDKTGEDATGTSDDPAQTKTEGVAMATGKITVRYGDEGQFTDSYRRVFEDGEEEVVFSSENDFTAELSKTLFEELVANGEPLTEAGKA